VLGIRLGKRLRPQVVADVVHEHVDPRAAREHFLPPRRDRGRVAHVERARVRVAAALRDRRRRVRAARRIDLGDLDRGALAREPLGDRASDPGAAAGDERDAARESRLAHRSSSTPKWSL
jgi:hypothetical protein